MADQRNIAAPQGVARLFTKADRLLSNEAVHESDPIGELIDRLSLPESPALPATFLSVTLEDVKNYFLAMSQPCDAGAMRLQPFGAYRAHERLLRSARYPLYSR